MADTPVPWSTFEAHIKRLDQADAHNLSRLETHIIEQRDTNKEMTRKLDLVIENQNRWKGRDGVILVGIGILASVLTAVITASILGVIR